MDWEPDREKQPYSGSEYQKWEFITLSDFQTKSCATVFSYVWLWWLAFMAVAVYTADTFTAVNLLVFDKWSSQIKPTIPFDISKWIFAGCILFSWTLCAYEWFRAIIIIRRGNVAECYLDPLTVTVQSMQFWKDGWRKFLVFAELTKSKKGADYVALFVHFQFKTAVRIIIAEGPRQFINALTIYAVAKANLIPIGAHAAREGSSEFDQFWYNVKVLYDNNHLQAIILFTMAFTLINWVFWTICFLVSVLLFICFLWHYVPSDDGSLGKYCRRKIDGRLAKINAKKVQKAMGREEAKRQREIEKAFKKGDKPLGPSRAPTLPSLSGTEDDASMDFKPGLSRQTTETSFASSPLRGPTRTGSGDTVSTLRDPTLPSLGMQPDRDTSFRQPTLPILSRTTTASSDMSFNSYRSDRPLLQQAAGMGQATILPERQFQSPTGYTRAESGNSNRPLPDRSLTGTSKRSEPNSGYSAPPFDQSHDPRGQQPPYQRSASAPIRPGVGRKPTNVRTASPAPLPPGYPSQGDARNAAPPAPNFSFPKRGASNSAGSLPYPGEETAYEMQPTGRPQYGPGPYAAPSTAPQPGTRPPLAHRPYSPSLQQQQQQQQRPRGLPRTPTDPYDLEYGRPLPPRRVGTAPAGSSAYPMR